MDLGSRNLVKALDVSPGVTGRQWGSSAPSKLFSLYLQSGVAGHSQYDAVLQTLDVGVHYPDAHSMAGLAAPGEVLSHQLCLFLFLHVPYRC